MMSWSATPPCAGIPHPLEVIFLDAEKWGTLHKNLELDLQIACEAPSLPDAEHLRAWAAAALAGRRRPRN